MHMSLLSNTSADRPRLRISCRPAGHQFINSSFTAAHCVLLAGNKSLRPDGTSSTPESQRQDRKIRSPDRLTLPIDLLTGGADAHVAASLRAAKKLPAHSKLLSEPQSFPVPRGKCRRLPTLPAKQSCKLGPKPWQAVTFLTSAFGLSSLLNVTVGVVQAQTGQQAARCRVSRPSKATLLSQLWWPEMTALDRVLYC